MARIMQPIVVLPSTHEETVVAAAIASAVHCVTAQPDPDGVWELWLSGEFGKSVRRAKRSIDFERALAAEACRSVAEVGGARAAAFTPMFEMPRDVAKLQVAGLHCERTGQWPRAQVVLAPTVSINLDVKMTTGKTAAQVAHGLVAWLLSQSDEARSAWLEHRGVHVVERSFTGWPPAGQIVITDAGHTEVDPGTVTVQVWS